MRLVLPRPISANLYWRTVVPPGAKFANTYVSAEAKSYKRDVKIAAYEAGIRAPISGRVAVAVELYPHRPLDYLKRMRADPLTWDDTVQCVDLDNCLKVLLDALRKIAFTDDAWVRRLTAERMEPDAEGERVVVTIEPIVRVSPQLALVEASAA
jgi:crossover junction endodeoxyribonuclease RusA